MAEKYTLTLEDIDIMHITMGIQSKIAYWHKEWDIRKENGEPQKDIESAEEILEEYKVLLAEIIKQWNKQAEKRK